MSRYICAIVLSLWLLTCPPPQAAAQVPRILSYQGALADAEGNPAAGEFPITFRLYKQETGGVALWEEQHTETIQDGRIDVVLGTREAITLTYDGPLYLGVDVGNTGELSPRTQLTASPYSLHALSVSDGAVTEGAIADETVVRSINGLRDDVALVAGENVTVVQDGGDIVISASGGGDGSTVQAEGAGATIGGGTGNVASGEHATVGGGESNSATHTHTTVAGGRGNTASGFESAVLGGKGNSAAGFQAVIGGGDINLALGACTFLGGGAGNIVLGQNAFAGAGWNNHVTDFGGAIVGGRDNKTGAAIRQPDNSFSGGSQVEFGAIVGGDHNLVSRSYGFIGGGRGNTVSGAYGVIGGGGETVQDSPETANRVTDNYGTVGGGGNNRAGDADDITQSAEFATVSGGRANTAAGQGATVPGGESNEALGDFSFAAGRQAKIGADHHGTFVWSAGGESDFSSTGTDQFLVRAPGGVGIGTNAPAEGSRLHVEGNTRVDGTLRVSGFRMLQDAGEGRILVSDANGLGTWQTVNFGGGGGSIGFNNEASGDNASVGGGVDNTATGTASTIAGGKENAAEGSNATIGGGDRNNADSRNATVSGGTRNNAIGLEATVSGGQLNSAEGAAATVAGGSSNKADGNLATVGGGVGNTASGAASTIPGGSQNTAGGDYSLAAGRQATVEEAHHGTFVWADNSETPFGSTGENQFLVRASGGVGIGTNNPQTALDIAGTVRASGLQLPDGAAEGLVLTSDADGVATWQAGAVGSGGAAWNLGGNSGTGAGNFIGTTDDIPLEFRVNDTKRLRLDSAGNVVFGNGLVLDGTVVATISGGGALGGIHGARNFGTVGGGLNNQAGGTSTVGGGSTNLAGEGTDDLIAATVGGGHLNRAESTASTIGGGRSNNAKAEFTTIGGGLNNEASGASATVGGGEDNLSSDHWSTVSGGSSNQAAGNSATVAGGRDNIASAIATAVGGGIDNRAAENYATVGGGIGNEATGSHATIAGGQGNMANGTRSAIAGGRDNQAIGDYSFATGWQSRALGDYSFAAGRRDTAAGEGSLAVGIGNRAGNFSVALGRKARAAHGGSFVFADQGGGFGEPFATTNENQFLIRAEGGVGIGTNSPFTMLHVVGNISGRSEGVSNHVAYLENASSGSSPDVLALRVRTSSPGEAVNFITFFDGGSTAIGAIEASASNDDIPNGVSFVSGNADFAEWLPLLHPGESLEPGDVVGVFGGKVTKRTEGAHHLMVVSERPIVLGNSPPEDREHLYAPIAFIGQARVKIRGPVGEGDYLLASGDGDGTAIAVAPDQLDTAGRARIVGRAWESFSGGRRVNAVVGVWGPTETHKAIALQQKKIDRLETELSELRSLVRSLARTAGQAAVDRAE